ncbi:MAG: hypothetical protein ACI30A_03085 [Paludibacteraceae bacterium]
MADVEFEHPVAMLTGKLSKDGQMVFRRRNGKLFMYAMTTEKRPIVSAEKQKTVDAFSAAAKQVPEMLNDAATRAQWEADFAAYQAEVKKHPNQYPKPIATLRGFVLSRLMRERKN